MTSMKIFKTPHCPCPSTSKIFHPLDLGRPILNEPPQPLQKTLEQKQHRAVHVNERKKEESK